MPESFRTPEEQDGSKNQWVRNTHEALQECEQVREQIPAELVHVEPYDVPKVVDVYNRAVHRFARRIRPKKKALGAHLVEEYGHDPKDSLWTQELSKVNIPVSGETVDGGNANVHGEASVSDPLSHVDREPQVVRLSNLQEWSHKEVSVTVEFGVRGQKQQEIVRKAIYLPPTALDAVVDQLNSCMEDLGWLPDVSEKEVDTGEPL